MNKKNIVTLILSFLSIFSITTGCYVLYRQSLKITNSIEEEEEEEEENEGEENQEEEGDEHWITTWEGELFFIIVSIAIALIAIIFILFLEKIQPTIENNEYYKKIFYKNDIISYSEENIKETLEKEEMPIIFILTGEERQDLIKIFKKNRNNNLGKYCHNILNKNNEYQKISDLSKNYMCVTKGGEEDNKNDFKNAVIFLKEEEISLLNETKRAILRENSEIKKNCENDKGNEKYFKESEKLLFLIEKRLLELGKKAQFNNEKIKKIAEERKDKYIRISENLRFQRCSKIFKALRDHKNKSFFLIAGIFEIFVLPLFFALKFKFSKKNYLNRLISIYFYNYKIVIDTIFAIAIFIGIKFFKTKVPIKINYYD